SAKPPTKRAASTKPTPPSSPARARPPTSSARPPPTSSSASPAARCARSPCCGSESAQLRFSVRNRRRIPLQHDMQADRGEIVDASADAIDSTTPFEAISDAETDRIIAAALGAVPDVYREPLVLYYYEERSITDVARSLGITPATTNKRLSRGRRYLAER